MGYKSKPRSKRSRKLQNDLLNNGGRVVPSCSSNPTFLDVTGIRNLIDYTYTNHGNAVYIMKSGDAYKIGFTNDVKSRMIDIQLANPNLITLEHVIYTNNHVEVESMLHEIFSAKNIRGEWYMLSDTDVAHIKLL